MRLIFGTLFILIVILLEVNVSKKIKGINVVFQKYDSQSTKTIIDSIRREKDSLSSIHKHITSK